jgi:uncharacterized protein with gpF-like domain
MPDAPPQPSQIDGATRLLFAEAIAFFRQKLGNLVPTQVWTDLWKAQHDSAFMVAGATEADLLADLAAAIDSAISAGTSLGEFRKAFRQIVAQRGWTGWTGEGSAAGTAWRTQVIYSTNTSTAYAAGRLAQLKEGGFNLWVYRHSDSVLHPRPQHLAWNGLTLPADAPFWRTHYPPNGWGCGCYVLGARDDKGASRLGGQPGQQPPDGWDAIDPATGEPPGIDKGWGYQPGGTVADTVRALAGKLQSLPTPLAKALGDDIARAAAGAVPTPPAPGA